MNILPGLKQKLKANDFVHSVVILISGSALSQMAVVLVTPILTRLYTPEDFGILSVYLSIMFTIAIITSFHYETAIPLPNNEEDAVNLLMLSLLFLVFNILLISALVLFFHHAIASIFQTQGLQQYLGFLPVSVLGFGFFQVFQLWLLRKENYVSITKGKMQMNLSQIISQLGLGFIAKSSGFLIAGEVIGRVIGGTGMALSSWREIKEKRSVITREKIWQMAVRYRRFPLVSSWSSLFSGLSQHLPALFIAYALGAKAAGWYLIANRILVLPDSLLGYSVKQVYIAKSAKVIHQSFAAFVQLFWSTLKKMSIISLVIFTLITALAPVAFSLIFGDSWREAGVFVQCMSILFFMQVIVGPISSNFFLLEEQFIQACCELARLLLLLLAMGIANIFLTEAWQIILCLSAAGALGFLVVGFFSWYVVRRSAFARGEGDGYFRKKA